MLQIHYMLTSTMKCKKILNYSRFAPTGELESVFTHCHHPLNNFNRDLAVIVFPIIFSTMFAIVLLLAFRILMLVLHFTCIWKVVKHLYLCAHGVDIKTSYKLSGDISISGILFLTYLRTQIPIIEFVEIMQELRFEISRSKLEIRRINNV